MICSELAEEVSFLRGRLTQLTTKAGKPLLFCGVAAGQLCGSFIEWLCD
jgi:hypothetical protein